MPFDPRLLKRPNSNRLLMLTCSSQPDAQSSANASVTIACGPHHAAPRYIYRRGVPVARQSPEASAGGTARLSEGRKIVPFGTAELTIRREAPETARSGGVTARVLAREEFEDSALLHHAV